MPRDLRTAAEPIYVEDYLGDGTEPLVQVLDNIVRAQLGQEPTGPTVVALRRCRSGMPTTRLADLEADLHQLLEELDNELQSLSMRLDRALSR